MVKKVIKALWIGTAAFTLYVTLYGFDGKPYSDIWIFSTWFMLILSFPAGLAVSLVHMALGVVFFITVKTSYISLTLEWIVYFALGYLQWFVLVPWLWRKWKESRARSVVSSNKKQ